MSDQTRVAVLGIRHESNTFAPALTAYSAFQIVKDKAALHAMLGAALPDAGCEIAAVYVAYATPSGVVSGAAYARMKTELLETLTRAMPVDGVLLELHGAMEVEGLDKPEPDLAAAVRGMVGPDIPVSVSLDLHGNLTQALLDQVNCITAFRTAPHRDYPDTVARALAHLARCMRTGLRPAMALVTVPLLIPGEYAMTTAEPAGGLYAWIDSLEREPGVLDASLMVGYAWADRPHSQAAVLVVTEQDQALAQRLASAYAQRVWERRHAFAYPGESAEVDEAVRRAVASTVCPVFISDSGDNVTAGAAGDMTVLLEALIGQGARDALVAGIQDAAAVEACRRAGVGASVALTLGNKLGPPGAAPLAVMVIVEHAGQPGCATVNAGGVHILITAQRTASSSVTQIAALSGLDPMRLRIVVVKLGYLMPDLYDHAPRAILALSPGLTDLDMRRFGHKQVVRPIFPLDAM